MEPRLKFIQRICYFRIYIVTLKGRGTTFVVDFKLKNGSIFLQNFYNYGNTDISRYNETYDLSNSIEHLVMKHTGKLIPVNLHHIFLITRKNL